MAHPHGDAYAYHNPDTNGDGNAHPHAHRDANAHPHAYRYCNAYHNPDTNGDGNAHHNPDPNRDADAYHNPDPDGDADAHRYAHAYDARNGLLERDRRACSVEQSRLGQRLRRAYGREGRAARDR